MKTLTVLNECLLSDSQRNYLQHGFADVTFYETTSTVDLAIERIGHHNIVMMDQFVLPLSEKILKACLQLELIIVNTTAYDQINPNLLKKYNIKLAHLPEYATQAVAEDAIGMLLELNNRSQLAQLLVSGTITNLPGYNYREPTSDIWPGHPISPFLLRHQLNSQTLGIIGFGKIGKRCRKLGEALGLRVIVYNRTSKSDPGVSFVSLRELVVQSDVILIMMAYEAGVNDRLISKELLDMAPDGSMLLSVAHPALIDQPHLCTLHEKFRGIGFDYLVTEEVRELMKLRKRNIIVTPHLGSQSVESVNNMTNSLIAAAESFANGGSYARVI